MKEAHVKEREANALQQQAPDDHGGATEEPRLVFIVDPDASTRNALARLLRSRGYESAEFDCCESFLRARRRQWRGCILLDVAMPGLDGLGLQQKLLEDGDAMPIIFLTGAADVPICAAAMRHGAVDFLMKPADEGRLASAIATALRRDAAWHTARKLKAETEARLATLTPREREVLEHVMNGRLNKQIAADLGTAEKTVKVHRARGLDKMQVRSVAELVRVVERVRGAGPLPVGTREFERMATGTQAPHGFDVRGTSAGARDRLFRGN
jgi:FixJ family two-component response regulator